MIEAKLAEHVLAATKQVDALILLDQVDLPGTGVATALLKLALSGALEADRLVVTLADSRQGLRDFPPMGLKMNAAELARMAGTPVVGIDAVRQHAADLALRTQPGRLRHARRGGHRGGRFDRAVPNTFPLTPYAARSTSSAPAMP